MHGVKQQHNVLHSTTEEKDKRSMQVGESSPFTFTSRDNLVEMYSHLFGHRNRLDDLSCSLSDPLLLAYPCGKLQ
jgi:hypothetical protein